jgi:hypothetical protein
MAIAGLAASGVAYLIELLHFGTFRQLVRDIQSGAAGAAEADAYDRLTADLAAVSLVVLIICAVTFIAWLSRAVENAPFVGAGQPPHSPRGAIGWWFVPFASFVVPYQIVADLHDRLAIGTDTGRAFVLRVAWWLLFIGGGLIAWFGTLMGSDTIERLQRQVDYQVTGLLAQVIAAVLAILLVRRIQRREDARALLLTARTAPPIDPAPA